MKNKFAKPFVLLILIAFVPSKIFSQKIEFSLSKDSFNPVEIKLEGTDENIRFSKETEESLRKGPNAKEKRFIMFTGDGSKDRRTMILNIFNGNFIDM
jgi:hypothetical protein